MINKKTQEIFLLNENYQKFLFNENQLKTKSMEIVPVMLGSMLYAIPLKHDFNQTNLKEFDIAIKDSNDNIISLLETDKMFPIYDHKEFIIKQHDFSNWTNNEIQRYEDELSYINKPEISKQISTLAAKINVVFQTDSNSDITESLIETYRKCNHYAIALIENKKFDVDDIRLPKSLAWYVNIEEFGELQRFKKVNDIDESQIYEIYSSDNYTIELLNDVKNQRLWVLGEAYDQRNNDGSYELPFIYLEKCYEPDELKDMTFKEFVKDLMEESDTDEQYITFKSFINSAMKQFKIDKSIFKQEKKLER